MEQMSMFAEIPAVRGTVRTPNIPDWFKIGSSSPATHIQNVNRGNHPMGASLGPEDSTCGTCIFAVREGLNKKKKWKCGKTRNRTNGPATDIRLRWRGCRLWERGSVA